MRKERLDYTAALQKLKEIYPLASPNEFFAETLNKMEKSLVK
jgi:hypothetical protein